MVRIGEEISTEKGNGIIRGMWELNDGRSAVIIERKGRNFVAIEGDDF